MPGFLDPDSNEGVWTRADGSRVTVIVAGEVDMLSMPHLADVLSAAIAECESGVDVQMSAVTFIESTGLRCLVEGRSKADRQGVDFVVVEPSDWVRQLLAKTSLEHLLTTNGERGISG